jgi:hypothetical protein
MNPVVSWRGNTMKRKSKKAVLYLSKETLVQLTHRDLIRGVHGGDPGEGWSDNSVCPTTTPTNCRPCSP